MNYTDFLQNNLNQSCADCTNYKTKECTGSKCSIGFALSIVNSIQKNGISSISDGLNLIPKDDMKYHEERTIAKSIACLCKMCRQCMKNHDENCVISLARRSLEGNVLKEFVEYPGNILMYLINVEKQNKEFTEMVRDEYEQLD